MAGTLQLTAPGLSAATPMEAAFTNALVPAGVKMLAHSFGKPADSYKAFLYAQLPQDSSFFLVEVNISVSVSAAAAAAAAACARMPPSAQRLPRQVD